MAEVFLVFLQHKILLAHLTIREEEEAREEGQEEIVEEVMLGKDLKELVGTLHLASNLTNQVLEASIRFSSQANSNRDKVSARILEILLDGTQVRQQEEIIVEIKVSQEDLDKQPVRVFQEPALTKVSNLFQEALEAI